MMPDEIATLEANIVDICTAYKAENSRKEGYCACVFVGPHDVVKYGDPKMLEPEIITRKSVFDYAESQLDRSCVPRIPRVKLYFRKGRTIYLVMERITFTAPLQTSSKGWQKLLNGSRR